MSRNKRVWLAAALLIGASHAFASNYFQIAGTVDGGGGKAVVCRDENHHIQSAETLDLYEGRALYGLDRVLPGDTIDAQLQNLMQRTSVFLPDNNQMVFNSTLNRLHQIKRFIPIGSRLEPIDDAAVVVVPEKCALEQLARFVDDQLFLDQEIWDALDLTNRTALVAHEAVYYIERLHGKVQDSRHARRIVAHLFSSFQFEPVLEGIPENAARCAAAWGGLQFEFFFYSPGPEQFVMQFTHFKGQWSWGKTTASLAFDLLNPDPKIGAQSTVAVSKVDPPRYFALRRDPRHAPEWYIDDHETQNKHYFICMP